MNSWQEILDDFVVQVQKGDLKTSSYPKEYSDLKMKVGFGQGQAARVPWIAILAPEMQVSNGFYPVYLYYKEDSMLILAYGISETSEYFRSWPDEIMSSSQTIREYFDKEVPRYGDSFVYKAYQIEISNDDVKYLSPDDKKNLSHMSIEKDLETILDQYKKIVSVEIKKEDSPLCQGLFYMEKQLEDFIIHNWENTELGKRYELIIEDGEIVSQQYRTDIGPIDILARDKSSNSYVVIELKKNQTSDDTVGQLTRYMGWVMKNMNVENVKGIIIAGAFDKRLEYALAAVQNVEVFLYKVDFTLNEFKGA